MTGEIGTTVAVKTLKQYHARLARELKASEANADRIREAIGHIEAVLVMLEPDSSIAELANKRRRSRVMTFKRGEPVRLTFAVLREATEPLTIREIAERMCRTVGKEADETSLYHLRHAVRHVLRGHRGKTVEKTGKGIWPEKWTIIPPV